MKYKVDEQDLKDVANAIRSKTGNDNSIEFPNGFISEIQGITTGSNTAQGLVHLTTTDFIGKEVTGTDGTNTVTGTFDENGDAYILVPTEGPWTFTCEDNYKCVISGFTLEKYDSLNRKFDVLKLVKDSSYNCNRQGSRPYVSVNSTTGELHFSRGSVNYTLSYFVNTYPLEESFYKCYSKVEFNITVIENGSDYPLYLGLSNSTTASGPQQTPTHNVQVTSFSSGTYTLDISNCSGTLYLAFTTGTVNFKVNSVMLLK